ncbi:S24 family peptidase [Taylorella asinigenitalis]|uniref:Putative phage repressor n=1 Tax=Taylorella asinigenitalis (strain MCE3) TaxID=1008459 RepID=G4QCW3_TAYAM|nr:S24 family peptidase [Taylorella asinigenitalis]AEP36243.1 putative phage repressor [Taylorella asinigenitalis MCE3]
MKDLKETRKANILRLINEKYGGSKTAFAEAAKVPLAQIGHWLSNNERHSRNMSERSARKIETVLNLPERYFDISELSDSSDYISLEHYDIHSSAGYDARNEHLPEIKQLEVLREWANENLGMDARNRIKVIYNKGVSMHPTIRDGDLLFVDIIKNYYDGDGIYVVDIGGDLLSKRLVKDITTGDYLVVSDNTNAKYETVHFNRNNIESLTICGRVKKIMTFTEPI